jgi:predicted RNA-binding protein with TRAM domain
VQNLVAFPTKRDQVGFSVVTKGAAPSDVVNIEIREGEYPVGRAATRD